MTELALEHVSYLYGEGTPLQKEALKDVSAVFEAGKITGLIGHTGSGKSTIVQLANGLKKPFSGRVLLGGQDIWAQPKKIREIRFRIGLVFQYPEYQLFEETIEKDIAFGPRNMGLPDAEIKRRVREAMEFVGLPADCAARSPFELSGGQKRRVAVAGILAMEPEVLILDEPAAGLDPRGRETIFQGVRSWQRQKQRTVILVSHSMEDMARYADRLIVMNEGKVLRSGSCAEIFRETDLLTQAGLGVPQITRIILALRARGIDLPEGLFTVPDAVQAILATLPSSAFDPKGGAHAD